MAKFALLVLFTTLAGTSSFATPGSVCRARTPEACRSAVTMRTGNQIPFRLKRTRWNNQRKDPERLRLNVFRSHQHIYAQVINDDESKTVASASTLAMKDDLEKGSNKLAATSVGYRTAEELKGKADAKATDIYARAFGRDAAFYEFFKSMETLKASLGKDSTVILSTESDLLRFMKGSRR